MVIGRIVVLVAETSGDAAVWQRCRPCCPDDICFCSLFGGLDQLRCLKMDAWMNNDGDDIWTN